MCTLFFQLQSALMRDEDNSVIMVMDPLISIYLVFLTFLVTKLQRYFVSF